jgi:hypothetical protein
MKSNLHNASTTRLRIAAVQMVFTPTVADNRREAVIIADLDLSRATRKYARDSLWHPRFLARHWRRILPEMRGRLHASDRVFQRWLARLQTG